MWLDYVDWLLSLLLFFLNLWLFISIYKSKEATKIFLFLLMYFLILHDCLYYLVIFAHNIPSYFQNKSIFKNEPILTDITVVILSVQWFFHLFFLPVFSLLHFFALFFPFYFRRFNLRSISIIIILLYSLTATITIPLFTSCCGFIYYDVEKYWFFDYSKPYTTLYNAINSWLQGICVVFMILSNLAIVIKLILLRKPGLMTRTQSVIAIGSGQRVETDVTGQTSLNSYSRRRSRVCFFSELAIVENNQIWGPEVRLAVSFVLLSGCWLASTLAFNFLQGNVNPFWKVVSLLSTCLNRAKWIVYCLGNRNIQKIFYSPFKCFS